MLQTKREHADKENEYDFGNLGSATKGFGFGEEYGGSAYPHRSRHGVGYSIGSGLVSIAQGAADQANTAIQNQHEAGGQAAFQAKNSLAQNAAAAAATAQAALAGKQVIVNNLEQQVRDTHGQVASEAQQLTQAQRAATATQQAAQQAQAQVGRTYSMQNGKSISHKILLNIWKWYNYKLCFLLINEDGYVEQVAAHMCKYEEFWYEKFQEKRTFLRHYRRWT